jgi:hypothetical protein
MRELSLLAPQLHRRKSRLEGGRDQVTLLYESERVVHDRVRSYTYSFHPARVVHLYALAPRPRLNPRHRSTVTKLAATDTIQLSQSEVRPPARGHMGL